MQDQKIQEFIRVLSGGQLRIYTYIMAVVANRNDADDIMQQTMLMMWQKFDTFEPGTDIVAWGIAIARYLIMEFRRKQKKDSRIRFSERTFVELEREAKGRLEDTEDYVKSLRHCVEKLSSRDKTLVDLRYEQGVTVKDISIRMSRTVQNVYYHLSRIHSLLLACVRGSIESGGY